MRSLEAAVRVVGRAPLQGGQPDGMQALPGDMPVRDLQDIMAYPFFSLAKSKRIVPIDFRAGDITVRVEGTPQHGIATIWDADVLIWAASQIVGARAQQLRASRRILATPYAILCYTRRGTSTRDYQRLRAALDRLQSTSIVTSLRQSTSRRLHRFSWINEWRERCDVANRSLGLELVLPDWFFDGVCDPSQLLTLPASYFALSGGIERWLYRLVRKHGGVQSAGWSFDFRHLYRKSGSSARFSDFCLDVRRLVARQSLPGYRLAIRRCAAGGELLLFRPISDPALQPS